MVIYNIRLSHSQSYCTNPINTDCWVLCIQTNSCFESNDNSNSELECNQLLNHILKITIDQVLIAQQFGVNVKGMVDATNALIKEAQVALKNIARSNAFINKEQWNVIG